VGKGGVAAMVYTASRDRTVRVSTTYINILLMYTTYIIYTWVREE